MEGMMSDAQPQQPQGFTGTVMFNDNPVKVVDSQAVVDGKTYFVSDDGRLVVNEKQQLMGIIQNGIFVDATPEIIDQLKQQGIFEK